MKKYLFALLTLASVLIASIASAAIVSADELSGNDLLVVDFSSDHANPGGNNDYGAVLAADGNPDTFWSNDYSPKKLPPHFITIDIGSVETVSGFRYLPRQDGYSGTENGNLGPYKVFLSTDNVDFTEVHSGVFDTFSQLESSAVFSDVTQARYFKLWTDMEWIGVAEIKILTDPGSAASPTGGSEPTGEYTIETDKLVYEQGADITAVFAGKMDPRYSIGICHENAPQYQGNSIGVWLYAGTGTKVVGDSVNDSGSVVFKGSEFASSLAPGEYAMYLLSDDWQTQLAQTHFVIVEQGGDTTPPSKPQAPQSVAYTRTADLKGYAAGKITITPPENDQGIRGFELYWADDKGPLESFSHIAYVKYSGEDLVVWDIPEGIAYPAQAENIVAYSKGWQSFVSDSFASAAISKGDLRSKSKLLYSFQVISDIHLTTNPSHIHNLHFDQALKDIITNSPDSSAIFTVGDNTDQGAEDEWKLFQSIIKANLDTDSLPVYTTMGNHEFIKTNTYDESVTMYKQYTGAPGPYYSVDVNNTTFIIMGSQSLDSASGFADIKDDQLSWLQSTLESASQKEGPVFVFLHQPLKNTVSGSLASVEPDIQDWFGIVQDGELRQILDEYPDAVVFSGHTHWQFDSLQPLLLSGGITANYLNTASVGYLWTDLDTGLVGSQGYFVEVYEDYVLIRGRDFAGQKWVSNAQFMLNIVSPASGPNIWLIVVISVAVVVIIALAVIVILKKKR